MAPVCMKSVASHPSKKSTTTISSKNTTPRTSISKLSPSPITKISSTPTLSSSSTSKPSILSKASPSSLSSSPRASSAPRVSSSSSSSSSPSSTPRISPSSGTSTSVKSGLSKSVSNNKSPKSTASKSSPIITKWDKGSKTVRQQILIEFLTTHKKQDKDLVEEYGSGASLFLARLIAALRITFNEGLSTSQLLRGIGVFIKSGVELFLVDFVESGSLSTVLDLLIHTGVSEDDKQDALELLFSLMNETNIITSGRKYKELLCQIQGHEIIVECMERCNLPDTLSLGTSLLHSLGTDNPTYSLPLQLALASLLPSHSPTNTIATDMSLLACHAAVQTLHLLLTPPSSLLPVPELINPVLSLLAVPNIAIHEQAAVLIDILVRHTNLREEVIRELVEMTEEPRGGQAMKQHHHVYINNVSLVRNGNIGLSTSVSTYTAYSVRDQEGGTRLSTISHIYSSNPITSFNHSNFSNVSSFNNTTNSDSNSYSDSPNSPKSPKASGNTSSAENNAEPTTVVSPVSNLDSIIESPSMGNIALARLSTTKRHSSSDLLAQIHHNFSARLSHSHHKSTSDLLSEFSTIPRPIINKQRSSASDLLDQPTPSYTRLACGRRASSSDLVASTSLSSGLQNTDVFSSKHSLGGPRQSIPPLNISTDIIPSPPLPSSPSTTSNGSPRQPVSPLSPLSTSKKRASLTLLSPSSTTPPSPLSPTTPTSPNSTLGFGRTPPSFIHGSPVVTTTTHEATAKVMHRLTGEWGSLLIQYNAIPAIICAIVNTHHNQTLQQLGTTLSFMCHLCPEAMPRLIDAIGHDLASALSKGYDLSVINRLRDELKRRETNSQREPTSDEQADSTLTIRMWDEI